MFSIFRVHLFTFFLHLHSTPCRSGNPQPAKHTKHPPSAQDLSRLTAVTAPYLPCSQDRHSPDKAHKALPRFRRYLIEEGRDRNIKGEPREGVRHIFLLQGSSRKQLEEMDMLVSAEAAVPLIGGGHLVVITSRTVFLALATVAVFFVAKLIFWVFLYPFYFSPLRNIPGPKVGQKQKHPLRIVVTAQPLASGKATRNREPTPLSEYRDFD